ncbi:hypothetical protein GCM10010103_65440 [Streptomyces paradoxus]
MLGDTSAASSFPSDELHADWASMALSVTATAAISRQRTVQGCDRGRGWVRVTFSPRVARCDGRQQAAIKLRGVVQLR